jgi:hypothetical protein
VAIVRLNGGPAKNWCDLQLIRKVSHSYERRYKLGSEEKGRLGSMSAGASSFPATLLKAIPSEQRPQSHRVVVVGMLTEIAADRAVKEREPVTVADLLGVVVAAAAVAVVVGQEIQAGNHSHFQWQCCVCSNPSPRHKPARVRKNSSCSLFLARTSTDMLG